VGAAALAGACLTGAAVACAALWLVRPGWIAEPTTESVPTTGAPVATTAIYASAGVPTVELASALRPHLARVEAEVDGAWVTGTGTWLDGSSVIVAAPLVSGAASVAVTGEDRRRLDATVEAEDAATGLSIVVVGSSSPTVPAPPPAAAARVGQPVAVVSARSATGTVPDQRVVPTSVSAVGVRATVGETVLHDAIQLARALPDDALGAPVVDADGRLVGIVVATSDAQGMAIAVPAAAALEAAEALAEEGTVRRAWLGVEATDVDPAVAKLLGVAGGARLTAVDPTSPAAAAGLAEGDVVTAVGEVEVLDASDLVMAIRTGRPGEQVEVRWHRGDLEGATEVVLGG
jgi:S1-C subfamily serine protease